MATIDFPGLSPAGLDSPGVIYQRLREPVSIGDTLEVTAEVTLNVQSGTTCNAWLMLNNQILWNYGAIDDGSGPFELHFTSTVFQQDANNDRFFGMACSCFGQNQGEGWVNCVFDNVAVQLMQAVT